MIRQCIAGLTKQRSWLSCFNIQRRNLLFGTESTVFGPELTTKQTTSLKESLTVHADVISETEAAELVAFAQPLLKRRNYESAHWDQVISEYRELQVDWRKLTPSCIAIVRKIAAKLPVPFEDLIPVHFLDLAKTGYIAAHVDSIKFSGNVLSGLSLLSPAVMRLRPDRSAEQTTDNTAALYKPGEFVDLYLPPRSLYVLTGDARYNWTHEIAAGVCVFGDPLVPAAAVGAGPMAVAAELSASRGFPVVVRERRISLLLRNAPPPEAATEGTVYGKLVDEDGDAAAQDGASGRERLLS